MNAVKGKIHPIRNKVLVIDMNFGEQVLASGIVLASDDGKDRGIHPRWAQVYAVGPEHKEEFGVGDWILLEHGRWSRGINIEDETGEKKTIRLIDNNCVMMWDTEKPDTVIVGAINGVATPSLSDFGKAL